MTDPGSRTDQLGLGYEGGAAVGPRPRCFRCVSAQTSSGTATGATGATSREVIGERLNPLTMR